MGISFSSDSDYTLKEYSDSDWADCKDTRRPTGEFCTFLGQNIISWSSRKQATVSKISTEAEYRTLSKTASEITWVSQVLRELGVPLPITPELYCDNLSAVMLTEDPAYHSKTKHFELDHHYVKERVVIGALVVKHIPNHLQLADIFTKSLPAAAFCSLRFKLGVDTPPTPSLRGTIKTKSPSPPDCSLNDTVSAYVIKNAVNDDVETGGSTSTNHLGHQHKSPMIQTSPSRNGYVQLQQNETLEIRFARQKQKQSVRLKQQTTLSWQMGFKPLIQIVPPHCNIFLRFY